VAHTYNPSYLAAKIERIVISGQSGQKKKFARPHINGKKKLEMVAGVCHSSYSRKPKIGGLWSRPAWVKSKTLTPK
jgi:hypothetical protein